MSTAKPLPPELAARPFTLQQALSLGQSRGRLRAKDLRTPSRSIRVPVGGDFRLVARCLPYTELLPGSVVSHVTAAQIHRMVLPPRFSRHELVHITRQPGLAVPRRKHVAGHRLDLADHEIVTVDGVAVTSLARTWLDLAGLLTLEELVEAGDHLVSEHHRTFGRPRRAKVPLPALREYISAHSRVNGVITARRALKLMRVGVDSPPETRVRLILHRAGLPEFVPNYAILDADGMPKVWADLGCEQFRTCIEYEGGHHLTPRQQQLDHERDMTTAELEWFQVKINKADMKLGDDWIVRKSMRGLRRGGWSG